ncbi:MAG: TonB-dependent receptor, partial [Paracoccaceae bacterium]
MNIITRDDFEGFEASAYGGAYKEGDGVTQEYDVSFGATGDRSRVFFNVSFVKQDSVSAGDRGISEFPVAGAGRCLDTCSSGTPQGRFVFFEPASGGVLSITLNDGVLNDGGANIPLFDPSLATGDFHAFRTEDRFNFQPFNHLVTPNKRVSFFGKAEYDITDDILFRAVATYTNRKSQNQAAPEPLFIGPAAGNGNIMDTISIDATNPFNPFGFSLDANSLIFAGRRPLEAGPRIFNQNVDTWVITGTLEGQSEFAGRSLFWDLNVTWSQSQANQRKFGAFNAAKLKQALGPIDQCIDPTSGDSIGGCVPFNFVGGQGPDGTGSITQEMLDFVTFIQKDESQQQLFDLSFNITGDAFELPAGPIGYALGYEHRMNEGFFTPSPVVTAGESAGVLAFPTEGEFNVDEFYGEINVPLLADAPMIENLAVNGAFRVSDYNLFGSETVFKLGANWRANSDLLIRFNYAEGLRAPGIGELFNTGSRFDSTINDPCSNVAAQPANIQTNCAALGVPASFQQTNFQVGVKTGGNPDLRPESSESFTVGFVYDASFLEGQMGIESLVIEGA